MKIGKNCPKIGNQGKILFLGYFLPIFIPGPISGPIWFPISGRRPETYFLAGRLDRNPRSAVYIGKQELEAPTCYRAPEPRNHLKSEECHCGHPREMAQNGLFGLFFLIDFWGRSSGGPKWHSSDFEMHFGVSGFRGSIAVRGVCK